MRKANDITAVLGKFSRLGLILMDLIYQAHDAKRPSDNLWDCIVRAGSGDKEKKIEGNGWLPGEIESYFHTIRVLSNKPDHVAERIRLKSEDAEIGLRIFLRIMEWFYCECEKGLRLSSFVEEKR